MRKTTRTLAAAVAGTLMIAAPAAFADKTYNTYNTYDSSYGGTSYDGGYYDFARVTRVHPVTQSVSVSTPRRECWQETVRVQPSTGYRSYTPEIVGGVVGAAVGNQFGSGSGRDIATVAGAILGGSLGHDYKIRRQGYASAPTYDTVERCQTVQDAHYEDRLVGYDVTYEYDGRTYRTRTDHDPGDRMRVRVEVTPAQ
jgi:uncharacterized protein YcfJ